MNFNNYIEKTRGEIIYKEDNIFIFQPGYLDFDLNSVPDNLFLLEDHLGNIIFNGYCVHGFKSIMIGDKYFSNIVLEVHIYDTKCDNGNIISLVCLKKFRLRGIEFKIRSVGKDNKRFFDLKTRGVALKEMFKQFDGKHVMISHIV